MRRLAAALAAAVTLAGAASVGGAAAEEPPPLGCSSDAQPCEPSVVALVDLRLPPAHTPDGGAAFDDASLQRVLQLARMLAEQPELPVSVIISGETVDALAVAGNDEALALLRTALAGRQILLSPWTELDADAWVAAGRSDVVLDSLARSRESLEWSGVTPSPIMALQHVPTEALVDLLSRAPTAVEGFVVAELDGDAGENKPISQVRVVQRGVMPLVAARSASAEFTAHLAARARLERRLGAYERFVGAALAESSAAPLDTLLATSASSGLTEQAREQFFDAVELGLRELVGGVRFVPRGPVTALSRSVELPVTVHNEGSDQVAVQLDLTGDSVTLRDTDRVVHLLEPGLNEFTIPVDITRSGSTSVNVTVSTPGDDASVLSTGAIEVRYAAASGFGFALLLLAVAVLGAWWLVSWRRRTSP